MHKLALFTRSQCVVYVQTCVTKVHMRENEMHHLRCLRADLCHKSTHAWKWDSSLALFVCKFASQKHMRENEVHHLRCLRADLRHKSTHAWKWDSSLALFMCRLASQKHTCVKMRCITCVVYVQTCVTKAHMREHEIHHLRCSCADLRHKSTHAWKWDAPLVIDCLSLLRNKAKRASHALAVALTHESYSVLRHICRVG